LFWMIARAWLICQTWWIFCSQRGWQFQPVKN